MRRVTTLLAALLIACGGPGTKSESNNTPVIVSTATCGNGMIEDGETCDGSALADEACPAGGTLSCRTDCTGFDYSACETPETCGDGVLDDGERCDGAEVGGATCTEQGYSGGELGCLDNCLDFDTSACDAPLTCGNGTLDSGEVCDGDALNQATCESVGAGEGQLACADDCLALDTSGCEPADTCGDGEIQDGEACDGSALDGATCTSIGAGIGDLACAADCQSFDRSGCATPTGFGGETAWTTPDNGSGSGFYNMFRGAAGRHWSTIDIDGDGLPDLVATGDPDHDYQSFGRVGDWHWKVYLNQGNGFSESPMNWSTPDHGSGSGFYNTTRGAAARHWSTIDIDGDGLPDLVATGNPDADYESFGTVGDWHWKVYLNQGDGFAESPIIWSTPDHGSGSGFYNTFRGAAARHWSTIDIDGDGLPDLVATGKPDADYESFGSVGNWHWKVYLNQGDGFAESPMIWSTPDHGSGSGFYNTTRGAAARHWSTIDIDGDGLPDLVATGNPDADYESFGTVGNWHWKVYLNQGDGFAGSPMIWSTPDYGSGSGFYNTTRGAAGRHWSTIDIDGDGLLDLIATGNPDADYESFGTVGNWYWKVYENQGDGFSGTSTQWGTPDNGTGSGFYNTFRGAAGRHWSTIDIDGDGLLELVHTGDPDQDYRSFGDPGGWFWKVYRPTAR